MNTNDNHDHHINAVTCGLGFVQERTLVSTPPPQEALHGVETVDQGLFKWRDLVKSAEKEQQINVFDWSKEMSVRGRVDY